MSGAAVRDRPQNRKIRGDVLRSEVADEREVERNLDSDAAGKREIKSG